MLISSASFNPLSYSLSHPKHRRHCLLYCCFTAASLSPAATPCCDDRCWSSSIGLLCFFFPLPLPMAPAAALIASPASSSVVSHSFRSSCPALLVHMVGKFVSFLSIGGRSPLSLAVEVLLLSIASSFPSRRPSSSSPPLRNRRCPLHYRRSYLSASVASRRWMLPPPSPLPLLSSAPAAQAAPVLFLYQQRCCLPPLYRQSCEQDRPDRTSPTASPPLHRCHRHAPPLCLIVTRSDLWPIVPSRPSSALLLLSQPLLVGCLTAAPSSSPATVPLVIFYSNSKKKRKRKESEKEKKMKGINAASCSPHFQSPDEILLSAVVARQHRRLLPRQFTPTLSVLHSTVQRQLMLHSFCCACPISDLLSAMPAPSFSTRLTWPLKLTAARPSPWLTT
ncbi:hypothetical protein BHM03_00042779 [Ensete ventricosum]|nr:hypothetical protein BHM03_00042779 [Ensete ventricosum]